MFSDCESYDFSTRCGFTEQKCNSKHIHTLETREYTMKLPKREIQGRNVTISVYVKISLAMWGLQTNNTIIKKRSHRPTTVTGYYFLHNNLMKFGEHSGVCQPGGCLSSPLGNSRPMLFPYWSHTFCGCEVTLAFPSQQKGLHRTFSL